MAIDLGDIPSGTEPTTAEKLQIRSAIGVGTTDAPTLGGITIGTGNAKLQYTPGGPLTLSRVSDGGVIFVANPDSNDLAIGAITTDRIRNRFTGANGANLELLGNGVLEQRNGTTAQAFRVYNTYTDASNYERGTLLWTSNQLFIGTEILGTGAPRDVTVIASGATSNLNLRTGTANRWQINPSGHFLAASDNTYDIGASGANRPRTIYAGSGINAGTGSTSVFQLANAVAFNLTGGSYGGASQLALFAPSDGVLRITNGATTDFGRLQLGGTTSAFPAIKRVATGIHIVSADDSAFAPLTAGGITSGTYITVGSSNILGWGTGSGLFGNATSGAGTGALRFLFGGTSSQVNWGGDTNSFPAIKRSTTSLQARLADDSAFTNIQGKLTTDTAYTATVVTPTGFLTLYDSTGTAYRVPCVV